MANTDRWIKGTDVMPVDFEVAAYSYSVGFQHTLDTRAETFSTQMCNNFAAQNTHRAGTFRTRDVAQLAKSAEENDTFFTLPNPHFTEEYPGFGPCTLIEPEGLSTNLYVFANEQTHIKWNFARIKSSTTALQPAATFSSSKAS